VISGPLFIREKGSHDFSTFFYGDATVHDVIVIASGPAGYTAAIYSPENAG
jgi:alkyl hydroperoxide reductase subunit AhpF